MQDHKSFERSVRNVGYDKKASKTSAKSDKESRENRSSDRNGLKARRKITQS